MTDDERSMRNLVETRMTASKAGELASVLSLMADDVIFMVPGQRPFDKEAFKTAAAASRMSASRARAISRKFGSLMIGRTFAITWRVAITQPDEQEPVRRSGYTLTILRKNSDGRWLLARDANLLTVDG